MVNTGCNRSPIEIYASPYCNRSEEHTSELHHGYISYAVFCLKKKKHALPLAIRQLADFLRACQFHHAAALRASTSLLTSDPSLYVQTPDCLLVLPPVYDSRHSL